MVTNCWVPHCRSRWYKYCEIKFHTFPVDKKMRRLWSSRIVTDRLPSDSSKVCSLHFCKSDYEPNLASDRVRLKKTAVPSRNLDSRTASQFKPEMRQLASAQQNMLVEQQPEPHKPMSFKMKIRKNPAAVNSNGGWKADNEFTVPVDPYYLYDESYDSSTPVANSTSFANPYSDENSLLQESGMQSDDNSLPDPPASINEQQSYAASKSDYDARQTVETPPPSQQHTQRNLRKRRRSVQTADDKGPKRSTVVPQIYQQSPQRPLPASPPKLQVTTKRNTALTNPCEAELVDGFCKFLSMQLKRLSAQLFIEVQLDIQKSVLQAQRVALETAEDVVASGQDERFDNAATYHNNQRMTNGYDVQQSVQNHAMDERVVSSKGGDVEVEWEECQIKSEPIDEDENDDMYVDDESTVPVVDLETTSPPRPNTTLVMPKIVTTPIPRHSAESTVLPKITLISSNLTGEHIESINSQQSNGAILIEINTDDDELRNHKMLAEQRPRYMSKPDTAFSITNVSEQSTQIATDRSDHVNEDNVTFDDIECTISTLSSALNGLSPSIASATKAI